MKNTFLIIATLTLLVSCGRNAEDKDQIRISGAIINPAGDSIHIVSNEFKTAFPVDSAGAFESSFEADPGYYILSHGRERSTIYLEPGFDLEMSLDTKSFDESLSFQGAGAAENNYMARKYLLQEENQMDLKSYYMLEEDAFLDKNRTDKARIDSLLAETVAEINPAFAEIESRNIKYEYIRDAQRYDSYHGHFMGDSEFKSSDKFREQFDDIVYDNESDFKSVPAYRDLVRDYLMQEEFDEALDKLEEIESPLIIEDMLDMMIQYLSPGMEDLASHVERMKAMSTDEEVITRIEEEYTKMKALTKGNDSPDFKYENIVGEMVALDDLKGKNVYIDVWATWCGPCIAEIPHLKTLEEEFHGKNIEFVSISVDEPEDKAKWQKMVAEKELKGIQLITDNGWETEFIKTYLINGIPRFILIDKEGNIVSADAPRPSSDDEIREMIQELMVL